MNTTRRTDLRRDLLPPGLDRQLVAALVQLAEKLDSYAASSPPNADQAAKLVAQFNKMAGTKLELPDFHFSGASSAEEFVSGTLVRKSVRKISDIAYEELLELITRVCNVEGTYTEQTFWLALLQANVPDPRLTDLIYWPGEYFGDGDNSREMTPKEILDTALRAEPRRVLLMPLGEPSASPNGGPAEPLGNSGVSGGPPSMS